MLLAGDIGGTKSLLAIDDPSASAPILHHEYLRRHCSDAAQYGFDRLEPRTLTDPKAAARNRHQDIE